MAKEKKERLQQIPYQTSFKDVYLKHVFPIVPPTTLSFVSTESETEIPHKQDKELVEHYSAQKLKLAHLATGVAERTITFKECLTAESKYPWAALHMLSPQNFDALFDHLFTTQQFSEGLGVWERKYNIKGALRSGIPDEINEPNLFERPEYENTTHRNFLKTQFAIFAHRDLPTLKESFKGMLPDGLDQSAPYACSTIILNLLDIACEADNLLAIYFLLFSQQTQGFSRLIYREKVRAEVFDAKLLESTKNRNRTVIENCVKHGLLKSDIFIGEGKARLQLKQAQQKTTEPTTPTSTSTSPKI